MKTRETPAAAPGKDAFFPDNAELAALRSWYAGLDARSAIARYLGERAPGESSRGILGRIRRRLVVFAQARHREDLAAVFVTRPAAASADAVALAIETLRYLAVPVPQISDAIESWLPARIVAPLQAHGI